MSSLTFRATVLAIAAAYAGQGVAEDKKNNNAQRARPAPNYSAPGSISAKNLQDNTNLKGIASQNPQGTSLPGNRDDGRQGQGGGDSGKAKLMGLDGETGTTPGKDNTLGQGKDIGGATRQIKGAIGNEGPVTGAKYGDTFGGGRVNNDAQSGGTGNFKGGGKSATSENPDPAAPPPASGAPVPYPNAGTASKGDDSTTSSFARKLLDKKNGEANPRSNGDDAGTTGGMASAKSMEATSAKTPAFDVKLEGKPVRKITAGRERDDSMGATNGTPMGRQDVITNQRGIAGRTQSAGGKGDGRTDQQASGGGGAVLARDKAEGAVREQGVGNINMDKALEINQKVNPGRQ